MLNEERPGEPLGASEEARILRSRIVEPKKKQDDDKKKKFEIIALIVLSLIFGYLIITTFFIKPAKSKPAGPVSSPAATPLAPSNQTLDILSPAKNASARKDADDDGWGRSPFTLMADDKKSGALILQGIVGNGEEAVALISQKIVKVGDQIDDKKVKEISNGTVVVEKANGEQIILKL